MAYKLGKFLCYFIILAAIGLGIASVITYPTSPYRHHPLFPSVAVLFVTAEIILITAAVYCLKALEIYKKRLKQGSTFYLNQQIAQSSDTPNNKSFQKRAALYDINQELDEIAEQQKQILVAKQEIIQLLTLLNEALDHQEIIEVVVTQNLIDSIKQKAAILEVKMEQFYSPPKLQHYEQILQNINVMPLISKSNEFKKLPLAEKETIIILDKKIYTRVLKDLKDFIQSNKTYLAVLGLELNLLLEKLTHKKELRSKDHLGHTLKFLYEVTHDTQASEHHKNSEESPTHTATENTKKPKLH